MIKRILKNLGSNYLAAAIGMGLGFFLIPFLIWKLGKEAFGLIILAESTIAFFEVATIGVRIALSRFAAFSLAKDQKIEFVEYLSTGRGLLFISASIVFIAGSILSAFFPILFQVPSDLAAPSRVLFFLITVAFSCSIPNIVFWSVLYAKQRFDWINFSLSFGLIVRALSLFILFSMLPAKYVSLPTYGLVYLLMTFLQNYLIYFAQKKIMPDIRPRIRDFKLAKIREILSFSMHTSVSRISSLLSTNALDVVINIFWGPFFNAVYSVGNKFPLLMTRLFTEATWTLAPTFTELVAKNDKEKVKRLLFVYTKLVTIAAVPLGLLLIWMSEPLIRVWVGPGFELSAKILSILAFPLLAAIPFAVTGCVFNAYGKVKIPSRVGLTTAVVNIICGILIGKVFARGLMGIAVTSALAIFFYYSLFAPYYACRIAGISIIEYWWSSYFKPCAWSVFVVWGSLWALKASGYYAHLALPLLGLFAVVLPLVSYVGAYFFVLSAEERVRMKETVDDALGGFHALFKKIPRGAEGIS